MLIYVLLFRRTIQISTDSSNLNSEFCFILKVIFYVFVLELNAKILQIGHANMSDLQCFFNFYFFLNLFLKNKLISTVIQGPPESYAFPLSQLKQQSEETWLNFSQRKKAICLQGKDAGSLFVDALVPFVYKHIWLGDGVGRVTCLGGSDRTHRFYLGKYLPVNLQASVLQASRKQEGRDCDLLPQNLQINSIVSSV